MIGIVGAGIGGLALSHYLDEASVDHVVLEAADRPGGVIRSSGQGGRVLDHGPQRTRVTPAVEALIRAAGLEEEVVPLASELPLFIFREGALRPVPFTLRALVGTDLLSMRGKLRLLMEPLTGGPRIEGADDVGGAAPTAGETAGELFVRKFGVEAYRNLIGPLYGGLFGSDPAEMYVRHALEPILRGLGIRRSILLRALRAAAGRTPAPPALSFRGGMARLPEALYRKQRERVALRTPVERVRRKGSGWTLELADGPMDVERVVLTCDAHAASRLLSSLGDDAGRRLASLRYNALALVHLHAETPLHGLGYQVSLDERLRTRGVTWNAPALGRDGVYTAFMGGARDPGIMELEDAKIGEIAVREFRQVTGYDAEPLGVSRTRMPAWDRSWTALDGVELPHGIHLCSNYESRAGVPGRIERARRLARELAVPEATAAPKQEKELEIS